MQTRLNQQTKMLKIQMTHDDLSMNQNNFQTQSAQSPIKPSRNSQRSMRASSKASQNEDILDVVNQKITRETGKQSLQIDKTIADHIAKPDNLTPLNQSLKFINQFPQNTEQRLVARNSRQKALELKSQGTELPLSQYPQSPNQEEINEMFQTHISLQKPQQIDVKVTQPTVQSPVGWQPVKIGDHQQVQPVFANMVMTPNTATTAAANKFANYPNIDAIFKNAKKSERNNDHLGVMRLKSKNSSINSKKNSNFKKTVELSPKPKVCQQGINYGLFNPNEFRISSKESTLGEHSKRSSNMVFNDKQLLKQKMFMDMMQTAGISTLKPRGKSPDEPDSRQLPNQAFNQSQLLVKGQHVVNQQHLTKAQQGSKTFKYQSTKQKVQNLQNFIKGPIMKVKIGENSVPMPKEILEQIHQIDSKLISHVTSADPCSPEPKLSMQDTNNTQVTLVDPMMLSFLSFEKHRKNQNDPTAHFNMKQIIQKQQSLAEQSSPNDDELTQRRIINTALFQNGIHEEDDTLQSPSPLKLPVEARNYTSQLRSSNKGRESFTNRHKSVHDATDYIYDLQAPQQYIKSKNLNSNGKKESHFKISVQGVPSQITRFRFGSTRSSKNSGEEFLGNRSFRNSIETENVAAANLMRSIDKRKTSLGSNHMNIQPPSMENNSTHHNINEEIQQFMKQNGKEPDQMSSLDQKTIPMDFKAYQVITEDTQNDSQGEPIPKSQFLESEFLKSSKYQAFQKMNAKSALAAKKFKNKKRIQDLKKSKYNKYKVKSLSPKSQTTSQITTPKAKVGDYQKLQKDLDERRPSLVARRPSQITLLAQVPKVDELVHTAKVSQNDGVITKPGSNMITMTLRDKIASQRSKKQSNSGQRTASQPVYQQITLQHIEGIPSIEQKDKSSKDRSSRNLSSGIPSQLVSPKPRINNPIYFNNTRNHFGNGTGDMGIGIQGYSLMNQNVSEQPHIESQKLQAKYQQATNSGSTSNPYPGVTPPLDTSISKRVKPCITQAPSIGLKVVTKETEGRDDQQSSKETVQFTIQNINDVTPQNCETAILKNPRQKILRISNDQVLSENSQAYIMKSVSREINENQNNTELRNSSESCLKDQNNSQTRKNDQSMWNYKECNQISQIYNSTNVQKDVQSLTSQNNILDNTEQTEVHGNESQEFVVDVFATGNEGMVSANNEQLKSANSLEGDDCEDNGQHFQYKIQGQSFQLKKDGHELVQELEESNDKISTVRLKNKAAEMKTGSNLIKPQKVLVVENDDCNSIVIQHEKTGELTESPHGKEASLMNNDSNYLPYSYEPQKQKLQFKKVRQQNRTQILSKEQSNTKQQSIEPQMDVVVQNVINNRTNLAMISEMQIQQEPNESKVTSNAQQQLKGGPRLIQSQQAYRNKSKLSSKIASSQDYVSDNLNNQAGYHYTEPTLDELHQKKRLKKKAQNNEANELRNVDSKLDERLSPDSGNNFVAIAFNNSLGDFYRQSNIQIRPGSMGGIDYSSVSNLSQVSIRQGDYIERRSPTGQTDNYDYEKFNGINVGTRRLKERLMNTSTDYRLMNKTRMDNQMFHKTQTVFKQQNISGLGQTGVDMQAHGKLDLILGNKSYKHFKNSRNDLLSQVIQQKCDVMRDQINGDKISQDSISEINSMGGYFDCNIGEQSVRSGQAGGDTLNKAFGQKNGMISNKVSMYLSHSNGKRINISSLHRTNGRFSNIIMSSLPSQTVNRQARTSSSAVNSSVGLPNYAKANQHQSFSKRKSLAQRSQNLAMLQNIAANDRVKIQKFEQLKIESLIKENNLLEESLQNDGCPDSNQNELTRKSKLILMNKDMISRGAKVKYKLPEATFDNFRRHKQSLGQMQSQEQKILCILEN